MAGDERSTLTRRSLLAAGAGVVAGQVLKPPGLALADVLTGDPAPPRLSQQAVGRLTRASVLTVELSSVADLVGASWSAPAPAPSGLQLRFRGADGAWSGWASADPHGHGPEGAHASNDRTVGDPVWTGGTRAVQLRSREGLDGLTLHLVDVGAATQPAHTAALPLAGPPLAAGPGQPPIIARRAWAPPGVAPPRVAPEYGLVKLAFVHHTENPNGYPAAQVPAMLRAIYAFHRFVHGWNDIGYNFAIDLYGRIFEARAGGIDEPVVGAQAGGYNLLSTGVAVLGTFISVPISAPARVALERLLAWKLSLHGVPAQGRVTVRVNPAGAVYSRFPANARVSLPRIAGHRDGDSTDCPGDVLYASLPSLRRQVRRLAPTPSVLTLALTPTPTPAPRASSPSPTTEPATGEPPASPTAPATVPGAGTLTGVLAGLDGTPVPGATIVVQSRTVSAKGESVVEATVAQAVTDPQGRYSIAGQFAPVKRGGLWLRALYAGNPTGATVSAALRLAPLTPTPAGAPTPAPTPPPTPTA